MAEYNGLAAGADIDKIAGLQSNAAEIDGYKNRIGTLETSQAAGTTGFTTKALMDADLAHDNGTIAIVTNDTTPANNGSYIKLLASGSGSWQQSSFDRVALVENDVTDLYLQELTDYKNYPCFVKYESVDLSSTLKTPYSTTVRGSIYKAFKSIKLYGFSETKPLKIRLVWNDTYTDMHYFRLIFSEYDGSTWNDVFDSSTIDMSTIGFVNDQTVLYDQTISARKVKAEIDLKLIPAGVVGILNGDIPDMIIANHCFYAVDLAVLPTIIEGLEFETISLENEYFGNVWARNREDIASLNDEYMSGFKRKLKYQSFRSLKLYGFDATKPQMLAYLWVDSYDASHYYRMTLNEWDGVEWVISYDSGVQTRDSLGIVDGQVYRWDITNNEKRVIADIDYTNLAINDNTILNIADPELIVAKDCFVSTEEPIGGDGDYASEGIEDRILNINASKNYFVSRRKPTFAFIFDDLRATDALVYSVLREYGFLPSFALLTNRLTALNAPEYQEYYNNGCTILAHSVTHPSMTDSGTITSAEVDDEMTISKKAIENYGMKISGWVTPESSLHIDFLPEMEKNFGYGFTNLNAGLWDDTVDPVKMSRYGLEANMANHNIATVKARIDTAITNNELIVFYGHALPSTYLNSDGTPYMTESDLRELLSYLKTKSDDNLCQVLSCDEAIYQYYKNPYI